MAKRRQIFNLSQLPDGVSGGVDNFISLLDTPSSYTGQAGKSLRVNLAENALEYYTPSEVGSNIAFLDLTDTPPTFTSNALLRVNSGGTAIEYDTTSYTPTTRSILSGTGLTGGGNLTANRTLSLTGQALALHNLATNGFIVRTGTGTVTARTLTSGTGITVTNGDGVSGNPVITINASLSNLSDVVLTSPTSNQTIFYNGTNWVNGTYTTGTVTSITTDTGLTGGTITSSGSIGFDISWGDSRYVNNREVLNTSSEWSHVTLVDGVDLTSYTTGSSGFPSTLGFAVAFYANTSDSTSGYGRAFAINRAYNTESYYLGSPNISGVHNGWKLIYHSGNLTISTLGGVPESRTFTINGTTFDLSANRTYNVGTVTSIVAGSGLTGGTITTSGTIALTGQALELHNLATNGFIYRNGTTIGSRTIIGGSFITVTNGSGASGNPTISLSTFNLGDVSNVVLTSPASGQVLTYNGTNWVNGTITGGGGGTVTEVNTGVGLTGGPITTTGTISVVFGTSSDTVAEGNDSRIINGQTAFGWGDHSLVGYLLSSTAAATYVPQTRTITINGTTLNLSANRTWNVGTVTSVATGTGLIGGSITTSGTISLTGQALALHNLATNGFIVRTGSGTVAARTITAGTGISISNGTGVSGNPVISSTITQYTDSDARNAISLTTNGNSGSSTYNTSTGILNIPTYTLTGLGGQPLSNNLTSLADLTYVSNSFVKMTANGTFTLDTNTYYLSSNPNGYTSNTGTVTSVSLSVPTGLSVSGSPVTSSGTITIGLQSGYSIPTTASQSNWNTAYNDKINSASFNTGNGILTLTQQDTSTITVDLDGRFLTSLSHNHGIANSAGTQQFTFGVNENVRFAGSGATSVSFNGTTKTVTISSTDTNTTYSAGTGLSLASGVFSFDTTFGDARYTNITGDTMTGDLIIVPNAIGSGSGTNVANATSIYRVSGGSVITMTSTTTGSFATIIRSYGGGTNNLYQLELNAGGINTNGNIHFNDNALISNDNNGSSSNIDHIWHNDSPYNGFGGVWHFVSDSTYKASGNSAINAGGIFENNVRVVNQNRTISTGTGLTGGGNLSTDRIISFDTAWGDARYLQTQTEGTFTPVLKGTISNPTYTPSTPVGRWTRFGNLIRIFVRIGWNSYSGGSGSLYIELPSLPAGEDYDYDFHGSLTFQGITWSTTPANVVVDGFSGQLSGALIRASLNNTPSRPVATTGSLSSSGVIEFQIFTRIVSAPV